MGNNIANTISKQSTKPNSGHVLNIKTDSSSKNYISINYKSPVAYVENNL